MKAKIVILALAALTASAGLAEARWMGRDGGDRGYRNRRVIIEQQRPDVAPLLGVLLLSQLLGQQPVQQESFEPAPRRRRAVEPKLRDNPIPLK